MWNIQNTSDTMSIVRGDSETIDVRVIDKDKSSVDITGSTVFFTVKRLLKYPDSEAVIQINQTAHADPANGFTKIILTSTDTEIIPDQYVYDLQIKFPNGDIRTTRRGIFQILTDITRRTS